MLLLVCSKHRGVSHRLPFLAFREGTCMLEEGGSRQYASDGCVYVVKYDLSFSFFIISAAGLESRKHSKGH